MDGKNPIVIKPSTVQTGASAEEKPKDTTPVVGAWQKNKKRMDAIIKAESSKAKARKAK